MKKDKKNKENEKSESGDIIDFILVFGVIIMIYFMFSWIK